MVGFGVTGQQRMSVFTCGETQVGFMSRRDSFTSRKLAVATMRMIYISQFPSLANGKVGLIVGCSVDHPAVCRDRMPSVLTLKWHLSDDSICGAVNI